MRIDVQPRQVDGQDGVPITFTVEIYNTTSIIGAYSVRVLGVDPEWVDIDNQAMSLFPDTTGVAVVTLTLPKGFRAGRRQLAIQVTSLVDTEEFALTQVDLDVPEIRQLDMSVEPNVVYGRRSTTFGIVLRNRGNSVLDISPTMTDAEEVVVAEFDDPVIRLVPGEQQISQVRVVGKQPWLGQPAPRSLEFGVDGVDDVPPITATFLQRPKIGRWVLTLAGLMAAAAVFAVVISNTFQDVVDENQVDPALLELALQNEDEAVGGGAAVAAVPASASGRAVIAGSDVGVAGITVELYGADNALIPLATAATDADGAYTFGGLGGGSFKLRFVGAGFAELWYEGAPTFESASIVEVPPETDVSDLDIELGGSPGSIEGVVITDDPTGITAELIVQGESIDAEIDALLEAVQVSADGTFIFETVPAPAQYVLVVRKAGSATVRRAIAIEAGQSIEDIEIILFAGAGTIAGTITDQAGEPLGSVTVSATDGNLTFTTASVTTQVATDGLDIGDYDLRELPTPGTYTITYTLAGFESESRVLTLEEGGSATAVDVVLRSDLGQISGTVSVVDPRTGAAAPAANVVITATDGENVFTTRSRSSNGVGSYDLVDLPLGGTYTVTFSGPDLVGQTRAVSFNELTNDVPVDVTLTASTGIVRGLIRACQAEPCGVVANAPATGGLAVTLTDGSVTFVTTSSNTVLDNGTINYELTGVPPGTYTLSFSRPGSTTLATLVTATAGQVTTVPTLTVELQAAIRGKVTEGGSPLVGGGVRLFLLDDFPGSDPVAITVTQGDGSYFFDTLDAPAVYIVEFRETPSSAGVDTLDISLAPGEQFDNADIDLDLG